MRFAILASGSKGNAALVEHDSNLVLLDCGISQRKLTQRMHNLGVGLQDLTAILITHGHSDHVSGLEKIVKATNLTPYVSGGTVREMKLGKEDYHLVIADRVTNLDNDFSINPLAIGQHDIVGTVMYRFIAGNAKLAIVTDLGDTNEYLERELQGFNALMIECNYDKKMLIDNIEYPEFIKARIRKNHMSNVDACNLIAKIAHNNLYTLVAGHLSENNNLPKLAIDALDKCIRETGINTPNIYAAKQHEATDWFEVTASS